MSNLSRSQRPLSRRRAWILAIGWASTFVWVLTVADNYLVHLPYAWGHWCMDCYDYYNGLYALIADPGVIAAAFYLVSLGCLFLLWMPKYGTRKAALRTALLVAPASLLAFEAGVYILLNYWWNVHVTNFLTGTPFTNEVLFWASAVVLAAGVTVELVVRQRGLRPLRRPADRLPSR